MKRCRRQAAHISTSGRLSNPFSHSSLPNIFVRKKKTTCAGCSMKLTHSCLLHDGKGLIIDQLFHLYNMSLFVQYTDTSWSSVVFLTKLYENLKPFQPHLLLETVSIMMSAQKNFTMWMKQCPLNSDCLKNAYSYHTTIFLCSWVFSQWDIPWIHAGGSRESIWLQTCCLPLLNKLLIKKTVHAVFCQFCIAGKHFILK